MVMAITVVVTDNEAVKMILFFCSVLMQAEPCGSGFDSGGTGKEKP